MTWPLEKIWEEVESKIPGFSVEQVPEIDSTNSELMRRARAGRCDPVLLIAETQTAGRGRMGKSWQSRTSGQSLCFSLGLPLQVQSWSGFSLAVGLAVVHGLDPDGEIGMQIKWPNDIWVKGKKLAGILIENR